MEHVKKDSESRKKAQKEYYEKNSAKILQEQKQKYDAEPEKMRELKRDSYQANPEAKKQKERHSYQANPEAKKQKERDSYQANPKAKKKSERVKYKKNSEQRKSTMQKYYNNNRSHLLFRKLNAYYSTSGLSTRAAKLVLHAKKNMKTRAGGCSYSLHEPKQHTIELYVKIMKKAIPKKLTKELISAFEASSNGSSVKVNSIDDQGKHVVEREIWVREPRNTPIPVDEQGRCVLAQEMGEIHPKTHLPPKWKCTSECKLPTKEERQRIVDLKSMFDSVR